MVEKFFVGCALGAENILAQEIAEVWPRLLNSDATLNRVGFPELKIDQGGVELECELIYGYQLNFFLRTANRVLLRLSEFRAKDFNKLHQKFRSIEWGRFFDLKFGADVEVAASRSRLNNEKRIAEVFREIVPELSSASKTPARIYIRVFDDQFTVSLDTSGEHLHFRGYKQKIGEAPLRETLAAICLRQLCEGLSLQELQAFTLIDPMAGSGTLLNEGVWLFSPNFYREYAFQKLNSCPKLLKSETFAKNFKDTKAFKKVVAVEKDEKLSGVLDENLNLLKREYQIHMQDCFEYLKKCEVEGPSLVVCNPPYGERLVADKNLFQRLLEACDEKLKPFRIGLLVPAHAKISSKRKLLSALKLSNGGIKTQFLVFEKLEK